MSGRATPATVKLAKAGIAWTLHEYDAAASSTIAGDQHRSYGQETVAALGVDPRRVLKSLVADVEGRLVLGIVPVAGELDLKALAATVGGRRAAMADPAAAERATGYVVGGISPFGQRRRLPAVVDTAALEHPTVFVSGGRRGLQIELAPADLVRLTGAMTARIGRP